MSEVFIYAEVCLSNMRGSILLILLLLWGQGPVRSIRLEELRVPAHAAVGGEALLGCEFDLEDDLLYSVKWSKDGQEFFRYVPKNPPDHTMMWFPRPGVTVDLSRSSSDVVTLIDLKPESAGVYRCEVSGETPKFAQVSGEKYVTIHVLPKSGPQVTGLRYEYDIGDRVSANCTSPGSRPDALLKWLVNNKPVHKAHLRGPWHRVVEDPPDTTETTLGLHFMVLPVHYKTGVLEIKCQATIAPLYHREKVYILTKPDPIDNSDVSEEIIPPELDEQDFESTTTYPIIIPDDTEIKQNYEDKFREIANTFRFELPPKMKASTTTELPENNEGHTTLSEKSIGAVLVSIFIQVILLL